MKTLFSCAVLGASLCVLAPAGAADQGKAAEAVAMTQKAIAYITENGKDKALAEFANPAKTTNTTFPDRDGKYSVKRFIETASGPAGKGWVEYKWPNPVTKSVDLNAGCRARRRSDRRLRHL